MPRKKKLPQEEAPKTIEGKPKPVFPVKFKTIEEHRKPNNKVASPVVAPDPDNINLPDYSHGYLVGYKDGHDDGIIYIVKRAEEIMAKQLGFPSRDDLISSGKYPTWWSAMMVDLLKDKPSLPPLPQPVSPAGRV